MINTQNNEDITMLPSQNVDKMFIINKYSIYLIKFQMNGSNRSSFNTC